MTDEVTTAITCGFNSTNRLLKDTILWMLSMHWGILLGPCWSGLGYVLLCKTSLLHPIFQLDKKMPIPELCREVKSGLQL